MPSPGERATGERYRPPFGHPGTVWEDAAGDPRRRRRRDRQPAGQAAVRGPRRSRCRAATGSASSASTAAASRRCSRCWPARSRPRPGSVRRGRGARLLGPRPGRARCPPGTVAEAVRRRVGGGGDPRPARHGRRGSTSTSATLSGGQVKRVALARALVGVGGPGGARRRRRPADPRRADQPPRPRRHRVAGGLARPVPGRAGARHPRPPRARPGHHPRARARPRARLRPRRRLPELARRPGRAGRAGGGRRDEAPQPGPRRAGLAAPGRAGPHPQAAGPHRGRDRARRAPRRRQPARAGDLPLHVGTPRLGDQVVELHGVGDGYGDRWLFRGLDLALDPRERLGIVGPNGAGKSTLLDVIAGRRTPREGRVVHGQHGPRSRVYDQRGADLDPTAAGPRGGGRTRTASPTGPTPGCSRRSGSRTTPSGRRSGCCRAASGAGCSCSSRWRRSRTCSCSTSPPTTSTSTRCAPSRTSSTTGPARSSSSATTGPSSSAPSPTCSCSTARARRRAGPAATRRGTPSAARGAGAAAGRAPSVTEPTGAATAPPPARAGARSSRRAGRTARCGALLKDAEKDDRPARARPGRSSTAEVDEAAARSDHVDAARGSARELATVQAALAAAEERWLEVGEELEAAEARRRIWPSPARRDSAEPLVGRRRWWRPAVMTPSEEVARTTISVLGGDRTRADRPISAAGMPRSCRLPPRRARIRW